MPDFIPAEARQLASKVTPVEIIALSGCSRPEDGRPCSICVGVAERHVRAVEAGGMAVVSAEDLDIVLNRGDQAVGWQRYSEACNRLRAALPERRSS